ncbi:MAG: acetolactate synthase 2 catalytic subunit [Acidobacteria bacterium]|nr:acetolactate synthase 2 catalytic subunit [Acidobacteriota bacterium]MCB9399322.1 acetolactate synthase 2 catalytic subunit [Acidobacteriota bacterium]
MNGAHFVVKTLERLGVDTVFGYPGGAIMPLYDALVEARFRHILVRHEQGAALAADAYARASGKVGVCLATSGPGATNLVTGLANAYLDSVPVLAITGQVPTVLMGTDAFQEVDVLGITMPIVKHSFLPRTLEDLAWMLPEAYELAQNGRPGPVVLDLPKDLTQAIMPDISAGPRLVPQPNPVHPSSLRRAKQLFLEAKRPLAYIGGGVGIAQSETNLVNWLEHTGLPAVTTLKGIGSIPGTHPQCLGMLGMHGTKAANYAVQDCDLLIALGARFDDRATGKLKEFAPLAKVIHVDLDPAEIGKLRGAHVAYSGSFESFFEACSQPPAIDAWQKQCALWKSSNPWRYDAPGEGIYAPRLLHKLSEATRANAIVTCDVGQHQMWVAQHMNFNSPRQHLSSSGLGTMGYGVPAAIGAQFAHPDRPVICVSGDGSFMMNVQELATISRYKLPIKILLLDNQSLGLVRQWQELFFNGRFSEIDLSDNPDFVQVAESFGIPAMRFESADQEDLLVDLIRHKSGPLLIHALIDPKANVWPLVPPGAANHQMMEGVTT